MMNTRWTGLETVSSVVLPQALGISFLSAVADRFGLWGVHGQPNVAWGNYARFVAYTAKLNWFLSAATIPALAIIATAAESLFGVLLANFPFSLDELVRRNKQVESSARGGIKVGV
jgi:hypothetical protein